VPTIIEIQAVQRGDNTIVPESQLSAADRTIERDGTPIALSAGSCPGLPPSRLPVRFGRADVGLAAHDQGLKPPQLGAWRP